MNTNQKLVEALRMCTTEEELNFARAALAEAQQQPHPESLTRRLQQQCSDWGVYWRAPDAHGVILSTEQALELLRDALGVEVEIKSEQQPQAVALTSDEVFANNEIMAVNASQTPLMMHEIMNWVRAVERAHGIGGKEQG